jgi:hypothetical protein
MVQPHFYPAGWGMAAVPVDDPATELAAARQRLDRADGVEIEHVYGAAGESLLEFGSTVVGSEEAEAFHALWPAEHDTSEYLTRLGHQIHDYEARHPESSAIPREHGQRDDPRKRS